jgi:DNA (cytosine-5)-methyltransferase 1
MNAHVTHAKLRVLDLFSGIGGFSLGLERTGGFETVAFCEVEEFPRAVLAKHWPDVPCFPDVRKLKGADIDGPVDVICGGYPCQPFSTAGRRRGAEDDRHLWPEFNRLVAELRPTWVIGENVAGHISMGLDSVLSDLEGQGYACRTFVIPACAVDAPHRRDRVWTVGHARSERFGREKSRKSRMEGDVFLSQRWQQGANQPSRSSQNVAYAAQLQRNGSGEHRQQGCGQVPELGKRSGAEPLADTHDAGPQRRKETGNTRSERTWCDEQFERCLDLPRATWRPEPDVGRVAHGISRRVDRLKALGNAVVPQIPEMIGRAILAAEAETAASTAPLFTQGETDDEAHI